MRLFRRARLIKKSITAFLLLTIIYLLINLMGDYRVRSNSRRKSEENVRRNFEGGQHPPKTNTEYMTFLKSDMVDEYKQPYKIIIWTRETGEPIFRANPHICRANISCDITFDETDHDSAHAIVFKADAIDEDHLPKNR